MHQYVIIVPHNTNQVLIEYIKDASIFFFYTFTMTKEQCPSDNILYMMRPACESKRLFILHTLRCRYADRSLHFVGIMSYPLCIM